MLVHRSAAVAVLEQHRRPGCGGGVLPGVFSLEPAEWMYKPIGSTPPPAARSVARNPHRQSIVRKASDGIARPGRQSADKVQPATTPPTAGLGDVYAMAAAVL